MIALLLLGALAQGPRDEGTLVVRVDTLDVARETYAFGPGRLSSGAAGWVLSATARYDRARPVVVLSPTLEIAQDSLPVTLQFDVANPREPLRVLGQLGRGRFTVRTLARRLERAREYPLRPPALVLDDSVFALYEVAAWFARAEPLTVTALVPRADRRETLTLLDSGLTSVVMQGRARELRQVLVVGGLNELVRLWLDDAGRLMRLTIPSRNLVAEREPTD